MSETDGLIEKCDGRSQLLDWLPLGTMLEDRVWHKLADESETLCLSCVIDRAEQRGVRLTLASLLPCALNLLGKPSFFDLFTIFAPRAIADQF
jgi:hypothetical protein